MRHKRNSSFRQMTNEDDWSLAREELVAWYSEYLDEYGEIVINREGYQWRMNLILKNARILSIDQVDLEDFVTESSWALDNHLSLNVLATNVLLLGHVSPLLRWLERRLLRIKMCQWLVAHDRWIEPWISLLDRELPGPMPSPSALRRYQEKAIVAEANSITREVQTAAMIDVFLEILADHSFPLSAYKTGLISRLAGYAVVLETEARPEVRRQMRILAMSAIIDNRYPSHPAWNAVLDRYFAPE